MKKTKNAKIESQTKLKAKEVISATRKINTVDDVINNLKAITQIIKEDVIYICRAIGYPLHDPEYIYSLAVKHTVSSILYVFRNKEKFKKQGKYKGTLKMFEFERPDEAISWLMQRIISNIRNTYDKRYYKSLYIEYNEVYSIEDWNCAVDLSEQVDREIELEKIAKFPKNIMKKYLRKVWLENISEQDLDINDFIQLCVKFNVDSLEVIGDIKFKIEQETTKNGNIQLCLKFQ